MPGKKRPSRKKEMQKAYANQKQYDAHQEKLQQEQSSLALSHWKKEKENFVSRINFYLARAKVSKDDFIE